MPSDRIETKFTEGPWKWDGDELMATGGFPVMTAGLAKNGGRYVRVNDDDKPIIAAAPDLYEALKLAHGWLDEINEKEAYFIPVSVLLDIENAMLKAREAKND